MSELIKRNRLGVIVPLILFIALAGLFLYRLATHRSDALPSPLIGKTVPEFDLPAVPEMTRDGVAILGLKTADLQGQLTLVNVFASWCAPCRDEHPLLLSLAKDPRIRLVAINYKDQPANARRFLGTLGNPYQAIGSDETGRAAIDWGVYGVPESFLVSADGHILYKQIGPFTEEAIKGPLEKAIIEARAKP
jgi:cytochrome c biogenesis protein CcmG/thiol:disulfide interchange protein DsbE